MMRVTPVRVNMATSVAASCGWPRCTRPPTPAYSPSEFSRFRLQFNSDQVLDGDTDHQIVLQYLLSLGPHGAHRF